MKSFCSKLAILLLACTWYRTYAMEYPQDQKNNRKSSQDDSKYHSQLKKCLLKLAARERKIWEHKKGDNFETKRKQHEHTKHNEKKNKKSTLGTKRIDLFDVLSDDFE